MRWALSALLWHNTTVLVGRPQPKAGAQTSSPKHLWIFGVLEYYVMASIEVQQVANASVDANREDVMLAWHSANVGFSATRARLPGSPCKANGLQVYGAHDKDDILFCNMGLPMSGGSGSLKRALSLKD